MLFASLLVGLDVVRVRILHIYSSSSTGLVGKAGAVLLAGAILYLLFYRDRILSRGILYASRFLAFAVPVNLAMTAWAVHTTWPVDRFSPKRAAQLAPAATTPRFIWVIFDEWDEYVSFKKRPTGLRLPEIDRFCNESLHAENVFAPAAETLEALPSLVIGRIVEKSRTTTPDDLQLTLADTHTVGNWATLPNVFTRARQLGVNAALAGFYHPYPRVLGASLVESYSVGRVSLGEEGIGESQKLRFLLEYALGNVRLIQKSGVLGNEHEVRSGRLHYGLTHQRALNLVTRPDLGLVLLHYPVPHLPGKYKPPQPNLGPYIGNLVLADITMKEIRRTMESGGQSDGAFVLLSSDHPLRSEGLKSLPAGGARRHLWIPFLLKVPGQKHALSYSEPFNSVLSADLILSALRGEIRTAQEAVAWLDQNRSRYVVVPAAERLRASSVRFPPSAP